MADPEPHVAERGFPFRVRHPHERADGELIDIVLMTDEQVPRATIPWPTPLPAILIHEGRQYRMHGHFMGLIREDATVSYLDFGPAVETG